MAPFSDSPLRWSRPAKAAPFRFRWALVGLLVSVMLSSCALSTSSASPTPTATPAAQLPPAWNAVLNQIGPNGEVSLSTALQAYTLAFGSLPGVQSPASDSGLLPSVTLAVRMILQHYPDLTPAQQQAVLQRLGLSAPASAETRPSGANPVAAVSQDHPGVAQMVGAPVPAAIIATPIPTDAAGTASYRAMLEEFIPKLNGFLSYTYTLPTVLTFDSSVKGGAFTEVVDAQGSFTGTPALCRIALDPLINSYAIDNQRAFVAHELMHCYQAAIMGNLTPFNQAPGWIIEGSAEWVGELVSGATSQTTSDWGFWRKWLAYPNKALFSRSYDAIGFYSLLDQAGISPWSVVPTMLTSQNSGPNNTAAYQVATIAAPQEVLDEWASSYERNPSLGLDWDLRGPGIIPASLYNGPVTQAVTLANGGQAAVKTPAYTASDYDLTSQADVVQVSISGTSRLHDSAAFEQVTSADGSYCTRSGGCTCPQGSSYQGPALQMLTGLVHLAVTGGPQGASGSVNGLTLQQFCNQKKKPTTPPVITEQYCQSIMTVAEANQIMNPPSPVTMISAQSDSELGVCAYVSAPNEPAVVKILFEEHPYTGPMPVPESTIIALLGQLVNDPGVTVTTATPVNGVGDQAEFLAATDVQNNITVYADAFYVIYGNVAFICDDFHLSTKPSDATQLSSLQQCAERVVARLDP